MNHPQTIDWLLEHGGPAIRYRTARELCPAYPPADLARLAEALLALPLTQACLKHLDPVHLSAAFERMDPRELLWLAHSSQASALENVLGRLSELGLQAGFPQLDGRAQVLSSIFLRRLPAEAASPLHLGWLALVKSICAWGLLRLAYPPDEGLRAYLREHLADVQRIAQDGVYDLYAGEAELDRLPGAWRDKPVLQQAVMDRYHLPLIHDLYILASFPPDLLDTPARDGIDQTIAYLLDPRFQGLPEGYGYVWVAEKRTCYAWGWSPHLPGFTPAGFCPPSRPAALVQYLELMARFPLARHSAWFQQALEHLESFRTPQGTYRFPPGYLLDRPEGYYVSGAMSGLGESRRTRLGLELESTFRMARLHLLAGSAA